MSALTAIFSKLVGDFMRGAPVTVAAAASCADTVAAITKAGATSAVVVDGGRVAGIVTERDVARRIAFRLAPGTPIAEAMSAPVQTAAADDYLYHAIARMRRAGLRHMPVCAADGEPVGMLNLIDALAFASEQMMRQIDALTHEDSIDGLAEVKAAQVAMADQLFDENLPAPEIQALLTHINNDIYRRVVARALAAMADAGQGPPPVDFCVIVMGSGGRGENYLYPDQDNGFILEDYPDQDHTRIDGWFIGLATHMTQDMDAVGLPLCKGFVMATNPLWRKTISQWENQIGLWTRKRNITTLRLCDIFFDFKAVAGNQALAGRLRQKVTRAAANPSFLKEMYTDDEDHNVALGWFGRFITEKEKAAYKGQINLKHTGTLPLIEAVRLLALREGIAETPTIARLAALRDKGVLDADDHDYLTGAFGLITGLMLRRQISDFKAGREVSTYVDPQALSERERDMLSDGFRAIRSLRGRLKNEFTGEIF